MNPLEQVNGYLRSLERRLSWSAFTRGSAVTAFAALVATVLLVLYINAYAFSETSLKIARVLLCRQPGPGSRFRLGASAFKPEPPPRGQASRIERP